MSPPQTAPVERGPEYRYHLLRAASERFGKDTASLGAGELAEAARQAARTFDLETLVLATPEARDVLIPRARIDAAIAALEARYSDRADFGLDLERNGLDLESLASALRRELTFDAVMQRVGARHDAIDEIDAQLFYELHLDRFGSPERRTARHILITVNDDFPENRRDVSLARVERIAEQLKGAREGLGRRFGELARKHSECPTALEEGRLGEVTRGQLYPALDAALFELGEGQASGPVESELGLHLLYCERISPARTLPFSAVRDKIHTLIEERERRNCQKAWIAELKRSGQGEESGRSTEEGEAP